MKFIGIFSFLLFLFVFCQKVQAVSVWNTIPNPVIQPGNTSEDTQATLSPFVLKDIAQYRLWYTENNDSGWKIGYATSTNGINSWSFVNAPVLPVGSLDGWENETTSPLILRNKNSYSMFYISDNNTHWSYGLDRFRLRLATSTDGLTWSPQNWVLTGTQGKWDEGGMGRGFSIIYKDGKYHLWYSGTNKNDLATNPYWRIGYATSFDGITWTKENNGDPVLEPTQAWELNNLSYPVVLVENNQYKMWYGVGTGDMPTQIAVATSLDGIHWTKSADQNPVSFSGISGFDQSPKFFSSIIRDGNQYKSWYSRLVGDQWIIGYATMDAPSNDITLHVPQIKQVDPIWANLLYDSANKWDKTYTTISRWGCAITSATMILNYYGITHLPDNSLLTPATLNKTLLATHNGYIDGGNVNWEEIANLSKLLKPYNPAFTYDALEIQLVHATNRNDILLSDLKQSHPDILEVPNHFVVATGTSGDSITINDPFYSRTTLADSYNNTFTSLVRFIPSHTNLSYIELYTEPTTDVIISNKTNQKVGFSNGKVFEEIASSSAQIEGGIVDPISGHASPSLRSIAIPKPVDGNYTITFSTNNTKPQRYSAKVIRYATDGTSETKTMEGSLTSKKPVIERFSYTQAPKKVDFCSKNIDDDHDTFISWRKLRCTLTRWWHPSL